MGMAAAGCSKYSSPNWDERKDKILKREWGNISVADLAERFNCRLNTIREHAKRLGLLPEKKHVQQA